MSASIDPCTGSVFDFAMPTPNRVQNSWNALTTRPHTARKAAKARLAQPMTGARLKRSASHPIGSAPSTRNAPDADARNTMTPLLTPNESRMSGASTDERRGLELVERVQQHQHDER